MTPQGIEGGDVLRRIDRATLHLLTLLGRVRPDERRDVLAAFLALSAFMAGHAVLETARDALFLASLPARRLPWVYLAIAVAALAIGYREPGVLRRLTARTELGRWLRAAGVVTAAFWLVVGRDGIWVLYALYVWSGVIASLVVVRFWTVLASRFTVTQAKRVFPVIAFGSVAGAIAGSALARVLAAFVGPRHLVLVAAAAFLAASTAPTLLEVDETPGRRRAQWRDFGEVGRTIWSRPYLLRVSVVVLLATVTFTLVDFVFKSAADRFVPPDDLAAFFATTYLVINVLSLMVQLFAVGWLLRMVGLVNTVAVVPAVLLVSTLGFAAVGGLTLALVLKGTDGALRHSLYRTGTELLFVPLSDRLRTQVKGMIDVLGQRGGQALASILILMLLSTPATETTFAVLACLTALAWLVVATGLREHYLNLFRETLHPETRPAAAFPTLDIASLETLLATLNTPDDRRVVAALDLLEAQGKGSVVPAPMLYHPSPSIVVRCLDLFVDAGREDVLPFLPRLLSHGAPEVRATSVRALSAIAPSRETLERAARDGSPQVSASARASLVACGWDEDGEVARGLLEDSAAAAPDVLVAIASALRVRPASALEPLLLDMLVRDDAFVVRAAVTAAGEALAPGLVDPLIECLGRRAVRVEARAALVRFGPLALARLSETLDDRTVPLSVRSQIPGAIASIGSAQAPGILLRHLRDEPDGLIRFKVLRALGRWRREQPGFPLDPVALQGALAHAVSTAFRLMRWRRALSAVADVDPAVDNEIHRILVALLRDKQDHALERAFRLLNLQSGSEEYQRVYRGLHSPIPRTRAGSRELLTHMVVSSLREPLTTLVDDLHGDGVVEDEEDDAEEIPRDRYVGVLAEIVGVGMESASSLAAAQAAELRLHELTDTLVGVSPLSDEHAVTLERARRVLQEAS